MIEAIKNDKGEIFINSRVIVKEIKKLTDFCIKDFTAQREEWIQEQLDYGNIDVRFEKNYTKNVVKNMKVFSKAIITDFDKCKFKATGDTIEI